MDGNDNQVYVSSKFCATIKTSHALKMNYSALVNFSVRWAILAPNNRCNTRGIIHV